MDLAAAAAVLVHTLGYEVDSVWYWRQSNKLEGVWVPDNHPTAFPTRRCLPLVPYVKRNGPSLVQPILSSLLPLTAKPHMLRVECLAGGLLFSGKSIFLR